MTISNPLMRFAVTCLLVAGVSACSSAPKNEVIEVAKAPPAAPAPLKMVESKRGPVLTLKDVLFDFEEATLRSEADSVLDQTAKFLRDNPNRVAVIEGHTDHVGEEDYNMWLSKLRSESVRDGLLERGVAENRIRVSGFGESRPVADNATAEGRMSNRRVEIVFQRANQVL